MLATYIVFTFFLLATPTMISSAETPTAYEVLKSYNFPEGLLPKGATGYDLDPETGKFEAYFNDACSFSLENSYQLKYSSKISGNIQTNKLTKLSGISVKVVMLWLNIVEVVRDGDNIQFSVGIGSAGFPIHNFYECPQCGCGLDCNKSGNTKKIRDGSFVSLS